MLTGSSFEVATGAAASTFGSATVAGAGAGASAGAGSAAWTLAAAAAEALSATATDGIVWHADISTASVSIEHLDILFMDHPSLLFSSEQAADSAYGSPDCPAGNNSDHAGTSPDFHRLANN
jgi:hypothetical protein